MTTEQRPTGHPLDNPTWHALTGAEEQFAEGGQRVRRLRPDVSAFAAIADCGAESWEELGRLVGDGGEVILNRNGPIEAPDGWTLLGGGPAFQMVLDREPAADDAPARCHWVTRMAEMVALVSLTEPGPFRERTIELGGYRGIFVEDRLMGVGQAGGEARRAVRRGGEYVKNCSSETMKCRKPSHVLLELVLCARAEPRNG